MEEDLTPITCPKCGSRFTIGDGADAGQCPICRGRNMRPSQWKRSQERALTATGFLTVIEELLPKVRARATLDAAKLATEGDELATTFRGWTTTPPGDRERSEGINQLAAWHRRVNDLLK